MNFVFRWIRWNIDHIAEHGVVPEEAEHVVQHPDRGFPRATGSGTFMVHGRTRAGDYLQVVYLIDPPPERTIFVIHARPLTDREKSRSRKKRR